MHIKASELGNEITIDADTEFESLTIRINGKLKIGVLTLVGTDDPANWPFLIIGDEAAPVAPIYSSPAVTLIPRTLGDGLQVYQESH